MPSVTRSVPANGYSTIYRFLENDPFPSAGGRVEESWVAARLRPAPPTTVDNDTQLLTGISLTGEIRQFAFFEPIFFDSRTEEGDVRDRGCGPGNESLHSS